MIKLLVALLLITVIVFLWCCLKVSSECSRWEEKIMVNREEFKKKLLNLLNNSNLSKKLDKNTGESKGSPFSMGGSK